MWGTGRIPGAGSTVTFCSYLPVISTTSAVWHKQTFSVATKGCSSHSILVASQRLLHHGVRSPTQAVRSTRGMDSLAQVTLWFLKQERKSDIRRSLFQYSDTNTMHFSFSLLRIKGLYMFWATRPQQSYWLWRVTVGDKETLRTSRP
jgi:hypothetical protein